MFGRGKTQTTPENLFGEQLIERKGLVHSHSIVAGGLLMPIIEGCSLTGILSITLS